MSRHNLKVLANIKAEVPLCFKTLGVSPSTGPHILLKETPDKVNQTLRRAGPERDRAVTVHNARHGIGDTAEVDIRHRQPQLRIAHQTLQLLLRQVKLPVPQPKSRMLQINAWKAVKIVEIVHFLPPMFVIYVKTG